ncbi:hypothetical protein KAFR_0L01320 [Kazachstania africana CBS 2517]|uniref:Protein transport protein SEC31 n=1 Tax=Kazachstania africana (strain ATCC 22294 / BCRC 22015 / CBS 2517 / CECT 1963 / NBRC 1671 / NRRL Y-8276) TaxID=1071382 RepID=H2B291_KAZAF|nr:hypothetical protein KAFR_0L01320 [Kazachstania africana CBS 2517]CCF60741.1 hypothetical protein KAFR_0L01320 [Kazachstania africana CBS 2517]
MVKLAEHSRTATFAWSHDKIPRLITGTASGTIDANFSSDSVLELWSLLSTDTVKPVASISTDTKFNDLDWSYDNKTIAGALDNGIIELFYLSNDQLTSVAKLTTHTSSVKTLKFNSKQENVLVSGSNKGEIFVWDTNKAKQTDYVPMTPGTAMTPLEEITSLSWNQSLAHVFASAGATVYASIWDLKAKKEVIHLSYTSPATGLKSQLSVVEWHPNNSTRVATATGNDNDPSILVWDLRNANTPLQVLDQGHSKGIISLDWCHEDESLMLSSGRDNTVLLWNPESGEKLSQFPTRSNWCFKTKFAPAMPDIFASASFDNKIEVQTLQNLVNTLDQKKTETKQHESETDFWNHVSQEESNEKPTVMKLQAPTWYGTKPPTVQWAFGGKLVKINADGKSVSIIKPTIPGFEKNELLGDALKTKDFKPLINVRLAKSINSTNEDDWNLLDKLSMDGKSEFLKDAFSFDTDEEENQENADEGEEFFNKIETKFEPSGNFSIDSSTEEAISRKLVTGNFKNAVSKSLEDDLLMEALIIALDSNDQDLKDKVKNAYFANYANKSSLSRVLYCISRRDITDMVENLDVSKWKYTAKAIHTYYSNDETKKNTLLVELGNKVLEKGNRQDALVLYLAANSIDKVAAIWLREFSTLEDNLKKENKTVYEAHSEVLNEFVERFTVFNSFINGTPIIESEELISKFLEFVNIISSSGNFDLASTFLDTLPNDNKDVISEKERVLIASGKSARSTVSSTLARQQQKIRSVPSMPQPQVPQYTPSIPTAASSMAAAQAPYMSDQRQSSVASAVANPYAPPPSEIPSSLPQPMLNNTVTPTAPSYGSKNPYVAAARSVSPNLQSSYIPPAANFAPAQPAPFGMNEPLSPSAPPMNRGMQSGQKPHLNKKANDGWNDLPLKVKEKTSRAKAVSVAPVAVGVPQPAMSNATSNVAMPNMPPPPVSRTPSIVSVPHPPTKSRHSSMAPIPDASNEAPKKISNPYAPQASNAAPQSVASPASAYNPIAQQPLPPVTNPYATATPATSVHSQFSNPYAPPPQTLGPMSTGVAGNVAPPIQPPVGPPPTNLKKKSHNTANVESANNVLQSIQKSSTTSPYSAPTTTAPPTSQAPPAQVQQEIVGNGIDQNAQGIPEDQQPIVDFFKEELERVTPLIPKEYTKQLKDCDKRLKILYQHLEKQDLLTEPTIAKLKQIVELMRSKKYSEAMSVHVEIATHHANEGGNWLTGVKRLIGIAEATLN